MNGGHKEPKMSHNRSKQGDRKRSEKEGPCMVQAMIIRDLKLGYRSRESDHKRSDGGRIEREDPRTDYWKSKR